MPELVAAIAVPLALLAGLAWAVMREDARLRRTAGRYRELRLEGIEELRRPDAYPEEVRVAGRWLREPDGQPAGADRVLTEEMERALEHTRRLDERRSRQRSSRKGRGTECLV